MFHVVPHLRGALKAIDAGVDGLVVEGGEGGGFKQRATSPRWCCCRWSARKVDVPVIAAGGIVRRPVDGGRVRARRRRRADGHPHGVVRRVAGARELKRLVLDAPETDTVLLNRYGKPGFRVLATPFSEQLERDERVAFGSLENILDLYFEGNLDAAFAFGGQVGRTHRRDQARRADHPGDRRGVPGVDRRARGPVRVVT